MYWSDVGVIDFKRLKREVFMKNNILVTGAGGFIGFHLCQYLLSFGDRIVGIDNMNDYYDVILKEKRVEILKEYDNFIFLKIDIKDKTAIDQLFEVEGFDYVINLAAQAGVRYSIENPYAYIDSNIIGFINILEACRHNPVKHLLYASSSSVYGGNTVVPFSTDHMVDHPVSLYAATKKSNELMAHTYSHLYTIPTSGLRFFTVYGPWGRPDMAYFSFTKAITENKKIKVFNHGKMERDFTYVDDIVQAISKLIYHIPQSYSEVGVDKTIPYEVYNIGNNSPVTLEHFIKTIEDKLGMSALKEYVDMQPGDVLKTFADVSKLEEAIGFKPTTSLEEGIGKFIDWYRMYYKI